MKRANRHGFYTYFWRYRMTTLTAFVKKNILLALSALFYFTATGQLRPVFQFQEDDSLLKEKYFQQAKDKSATLVRSLGKEYKDEYKNAYESRFFQVGKMIRSNRTVTSKEAHDYLQSIVKRIIDSNSELKEIETRVLFSRDWWPNAYSMGEGTIMFNAGLLVHLENEAELIFVLSHELAHYYLDHGNKGIRRSIERTNSDEVKTELKRLSKTEYRVGQQYEKLLRSLIYDSRQHSRENEAEADRYAFIFMKNTGFATTAITSCLQLLNKIDDSLLHKPLVLDQVLNFPGYPFKKKWTQNESVLFGAMKDDDSPETLKERDSLKTHPDCSKRIAKLADSISGNEGGKLFGVNESVFKKLKQEFNYELSEQAFRDKNLGRNLYYNLILLQDGEELPLAIYSIARDLNILYESQKDHSLGDWLYPEKLNQPADYNLLLRMLSRLKLDEIAALSYQFCEKYRSQMTGYLGFEQEYLKAVNRTR